MIEIFSLDTVVDILNDASKLPNDSKLLFLVQPFTFRGATIYFPHTKNGGVIVVINGFEHHIDLNKDYPTNEEGVTITGVDIISNRLSEL